VLRIFPWYAEEPKNLSLVTELSVVSSANSIRTNVEFSKVGSRSGSRNQQPRQFYLGKIVHVNQYVLDLFNLIEIYQNTLRNAQHKSYKM
jgi:hypothetical protein